MSENSENSNKSIDDFLNEVISLGEEETRNPPIDIILLIAKRKYGYITHCVPFKADVREDELGGSILKNWQFAVRAKSITDFAKRYEAQLQENGMKYLRNASDDNRAYVSYTMPNRDDGSPEVQQLWKLTALHAYLDKHDREIFGV